MIYTVLMQRNADSESHHYIIGAYTTFQQARFAADCEETWRGGKYTANIQSWIPDSPVPPDIYDYHMSCV